MKKNNIVSIISALFILLFLYTALTKLSDFHRFRAMLYGSPWVGKLAPTIAWGLPLTEICISILLFFPKSRRLGLWCSLILMSIFTVYIAYMLYFSSVRPCNCGGVLQLMTWNQHLIFNIFFTLLAILGLWLDKKLGFHHNRDNKHSLNPARI